MREIYNDLATQARLSFYNCYGVKTRELCLESGASIYLEPSSSRIYLDCAREVFVYSGAGKLALSDCLKPFSFVHINAKELEAYLLQAKPPRKHLSEYESFKELASLNLEKGLDYITPPRYNDLWEAILHAMETPQCNYKPL